MSRLTKAQAKVLAYIQRMDGVVYVARSKDGYWAPLRRLFRRGLIERLPHQNSKYRSTFVIVSATPAGRAALASHRQENEGHG